MNLLKHAPKSDALPLERVEEGLSQILSITKGVVKEALRAIQVEPMFLRQGLVYAHHLKYRLQTNAILSDPSSLATVSAFLFLLGVMGHGSLQMLTAEKKQSIALLPANEFVTNANFGLSLPGSTNLSIDWSFLNREFDGKPTEGLENLFSENTLPFPDAPPTHWDKLADADPHFFDYREGGEFTTEELAKHTETLAPGVTVIRDHGLTFYVVKKGDTLSGIAQKLKKIQEFDHVDWKSELSSLNVKDSQNVLKPDMWLPLPLAEKDRILTDQQFSNYAYQSVEEMLTHPKYGERIKTLMETVPMNDIIASILAIAKQEGGGKPLGQFVLHRYEPRKGKKHTPPFFGVFSFGYFHILLEKAGKRAQENIGATYGQLLSPEIGTKAALAFICEKTNRPLSDFFPLSDPEKAKAFAIIDFLHNKVVRREEMGIMSL